VAAHHQIPGVTDRTTRRDRVAAIGPLGWLIILIYCPAPNFGEVVLAPLTPPQRPLSADDAATILRGYDITAPAFLDTRGLNEPGERSQS
jgi:hypothetical protein